MFLSMAYVGNRAIHLPSSLNPLNQPNPSILSYSIPSGPAGQFTGRRERRHQNSLSGIHQSIWAAAPPYNNKLFS